MSVEQLLMEESINAARVGWFVRAVTLDDDPSITAENPTDPYDRWVFLPAKKQWMNLATEELTETIPLCKHKTKDNHDADDDQRHGGDHGLDRQGPGHSPRIL